MKILTTSIIALLLGAGASFATCSNGGQWPDCDEPPVVTPEPEPEPVPEPTPEPEPPTVVDPSPQPNPTPVAPTPQPTPTGPVMITEDERKDNPPYIPKRRCVDVNHTPENSLGITIQKIFDGKPVKAQSSPVKSCCWDRGMHVVAFDRDRISEGEALDACDKALGPWW